MQVDQSGPPIIGSVKMMENRQVDTKVTTTFVPLPADREFDPASTVSGITQGLLSAKGITPSTSQ